MRINISINRWKICYWLLMVCLLWAPVTGIFDVIYIFRQKYVDVLLTSPEATATRVVRDFLIVIFYIYFILFIIIPDRIKLRCNTNGNIFVISILLLSSSILLSVLYSILVVKLPLMVIALGLKSFLYVPLFPIAWIFSKEYPYAFKGIRKAILFILIIELLFGLLEIRYAPPYHGVTVFGLGSIPEGTFTHYNIYAAFLSFMIMGHLFIRNLSITKILFISTLIMIFLAQSRSGWVIVAFLLSIWFVKDFIKDSSIRGAVVAILPFFMLLIIVLPSMVFVARQTAAQRGVMGDPRWHIWATYLTRDLSLSQVGIGSGVGLASQAVFTYFGDPFPGQFVADSMHLALFAQYGLLGMTLFYCVMFLIMYELYGWITFIVSMVILIMGFTSNFLETYPINLLLPVMLAFHDLDFGHFSPVKPAPRINGY